MSPAEQLPLLEFESSAFPVTPGEDEETNPGIYGRALAQWLAEQLRTAGFNAGYLISEEFGWCVPVASTPHSLHVVCASIGEAPNRWRVLRFRRGRGDASPVGQGEESRVGGALFAAVRRSLWLTPTISNLREEAEGPNKALERPGLNPCVDAEAVRPGRSPRR